MSYTFGYNFRLTPGLTVDALDETYVVINHSDLSGTDFFPTARNGQTFGYDQIDAVSTEAYDDSPSLDRRLAGHHQQANNGTQARFVALLPSPGIYDVHLAAGNTVFAQAAMNFDIYDDQAIIASIYLPSGIGGDLWLDALQNVYSATDWPVNEKPLRLTFTSGIFRLRYGLSPNQLNGTNQNETLLAHVRLTQVIALSTTKTYGGSGGLLLAAPPQSKLTQFVPQLATTHTYTPTGGWQFAGAAQTNPFLTASKTYVGTGVLRFAGAANTVATQPPPRLPQRTTIPWHDQMTTKGPTL